MSSSERFLVELLKAELWGRKHLLSLNGEIDYTKVLRLAQEQAVVGLVAAGLEHTEGIIYETKLKFIGLASQIKQRNEAMNCLIAELVKKTQSVGITSILVKGQGVAQCYERPLLRTSGDVDLLFSKTEFNKAIVFFTRITDAKVVQNAKYTKSFGVRMGPWFVEMHGTLRNILSSKMDCLIDAVQEDTFNDRKLRVWHNEGVNVQLPGADNDVFFIFVHFIRHCYKGGICIRQICDWCRLLWTYKDSLNLELLKIRIVKAGLMDEWRAFAALAVDWLGMLPEAMPMYDDNIRWHKKGEKMIEHILKGTHGKMRDTLSIAKIFPWNTIRFLPAIFFNLNWLKVRERILRK